MPRLKPSDRRARQDKLQLLKRKEELERGLPFLYGWPWYKWAREFFESRNKINLLLAGNQLSKSSSQIRKCIDWATNQKKWPELWRDTPNMFWYLYPTAKQANIEFNTKWKQFLPTGRFKDDPVYGWREEWRAKEIHAIHFNSGVSVYFKFYSQDSQSLQTGSVYSIFADEELPDKLYNELIFRVSATDGYFHMVFTATLGQEFWRLVMEPGPQEQEKLSEASKWIVSAYDCQRYEDGTLSPWTDEKIQMVMNRCGTEAEIQKRIYGRFIMDQGGRKYPTFDIKRHMKPVEPVPKDWHIYVGADVGSGGQQNHPGAICWIAVNPIYTQGRVFAGWRGDGLETTAGDILKQFQLMKKELKVSPLGQFYDGASKDFEMLAVRNGEPFQPADKSHERGEQIINTLFKNNLLTIDQASELHKLASELMSLRKTTPKTRAKDDFIDSMRYGLTRIPWDWSVIGGELLTEASTPTQKTPLELELEARRRAFDTKKESDRIEDEFNEWNDLYGA